MTATKRTALADHAMRAFQTPFSTFFTFLISLTFLTFFTWPPFSYAADKQKAVASVNGTLITETDLEANIDAYIKQSTFHGTITNETRNEYRKLTLDAMIEGELIYQEGKARGITVEEGAIDRIIKGIMKGYKSKEEFEGELKASGVTMNEFRALQKKIEVRKKVMEGLEKKSAYSNKELKDYYTANKEKFKRPEYLRLRVISFKIPTNADIKELMEKATDIVKRAKSGEDFAVLAEKYSEDNYRVKGGDIGWVHKGRLEPEIEDVAFKLKAGEISEPTETTSGYYIIVKLEEKKPPEQKSFSEVKDSLRQRLQSKRYREMREAYIKALKANAKIEIY